MLPRVVMLRSASPRRRPASALIGSARESFIRGRVPSIITAGTLLIGPSALPAIFAKTLAGTAEAAPVGPGTVHEESRRISGRILGPDGQPRAGAWGRLF